MQPQPSLNLNDGTVIPQLGLGVWQVPDEQAARVVSHAISTGYRLIDTAAIYDNELGTGSGIAKAAVPRAELFITTKLWNSQHRNAARAFPESLRRLKLDYLDLYLIHWPKPRQNAYVEAWKTLVELKAAGQVKSIGVSNFTIAHLQRILDETGIVPSVNQIELHPRFQQNELAEFHAKLGITTESWSPLGQGTLFDDQELKSLASKHGKTVAQVIIRWHLDRGFIVIPKSVTPSRIDENFDVLDFELEKEDMAKIAALDRPDGRIGPDPDTANF
ncbi:MAG TPA: aldo/keto reductase [Chthoniobacterales bacterium]|nr:aldo/keto reductase [Chthoniobacterales bacterium]